jgi:hypothetical protein
MKDGYRSAGVPPSASRIMLANGQLSTDSIGAQSVDGSTGEASGASNSGAAAGESSLVKGDFDPARCL